VSNPGIDSRVPSVAESDFPIFAATIGKSGRDEGRVEGGKLCANVINAPIGGPYKMEKLRAREERFRFRSFLCDSCASSAATGRARNSRGIDRRFCVSDNRPTITRNRLREMMS